MKQMLKLLIPMTMLPSLAFAVPVYKYDLVGNSIIKEKCEHEGNTLGSKLNFGIMSKSSSNYNVKIKVRACTNGFGVQAFNFLLDMPPALFNESYLMSMQEESTVAAGRVRITRNKDANGRAVFSVDPKSFGSAASGIRSINFYVNLDKKQRDILTRRAGAFVWSQIHITYQKGIMPRVTLTGPFMVATDEKL